MVDDQLVGQHWFGDVRFVLRLFAGLIVLAIAALTEQTELLLLLLIAFECAALNEHHRELNPLPPSRR